jgi:hypothetical protein
MNYLTTFTAAALAAAALASPAKADLLLLPDPGTIYDGVPVTHQYDQTVVYSASLLAQIQSNVGLPAPFTNVNYQFSTGTGTLPIIVYTGSNGATNPTPFATPLSACGGSCSSFDGTWGLGVSGTVGALITQIGSNIPVFVFDHNQSPGQGANLQALGRVAIYNGTTLVQQWAFDMGTSNTIDPTNPADYVTSCGTFTVGGGGPANPPCDFGGTTTSGTTYTVDNNKGSGKPDFFLTALGLDLSNFDPNDTIVVEMHMSGLDGGFEELDVAGGEFVTAVPEPSSLALFGLGLIAAGAFRRTIASA